MSFLAVQVKKKEWKDEWKDLFEPDGTVSVQRAKFEQYDNGYEQKRKASEVNYNVKTF